MYLMCPCKGRVKYGHITKAGHKLLNTGLIDMKCTEKK